MYTGVYIHTSSPFDKKSREHRLQASMPPRKAPPALSRRNPYAAAAAPPAPASAKGKGGKRGGPAGVAAASGYASNRMANARGAQANSNNSVSSPCGGATKALMYVLLLAVIAAIAYVLYRVIVYGRKQDKASKQMESEYGSEYGKDYKKKGSGVSFDPVLSSKYYYAKERLYEGFEDEIADEPGDEYDGKEGRRIEDRKKQKEKNKNDVDKKNGGGTIIYFHMDGCGHCRRFDPTWKEFKNKHEEELKQKGVKLASYESREPLARELDISGFPSIVFVTSEGEKKDTFKGPRTVTELVLFGKKHAAQ